MHTSSTPIRGKCLCGSVEFEISVRPALLQCHCSLCRKQSGSVANAAAIIEAKHFRWISGEDKISSFVRSPRFRSDFCSVCGSPVPNPQSERYMWVPSGLFEGNEPLEIAVHIYVGSKSHWDTLPNPGVRFETRPDTETLVRLLA